MRNSTTGRNPSPRRRITSSVQPSTCPSPPYTGSHDVTPWTTPSASTARPTRTRGSSASSTPPRVKPISGIPLSPTHSSEIARTCATSDHGSSASVTRRKVTPCLPRAVERRAHVLPRLPVNSRSSRSTRVSSATCTRAQPSESVTAVVSLGDGEQARHQPGVVAQLGERPDRAGGVGADRVAEGDGHPGVAAVGEVALGVGAEEVGVLRPERHPGQRAAAVALQQLGGAVDVAGAERAAPLPPGGDAECPARGDEQRQHGAPEHGVGDEERRVFDRVGQAEDLRDEHDHGDHDAERHDQRGEPHRPSPGGAFAAPQAVDHQRDHHEHDRQLRHRVGLVRRGAERADAGRDAHHDHAPRPR